MNPLLILAIIAAGTTAIVILLVRGLGVGVKP
jgi:hypothetical protein